jgi:hypothetical protein
VTAAPLDIGGAGVGCSERANGGGKLSFVFKLEAEALETLGQRIEVGSIVHADEAAH